MIVDPHLNNIMTISLFRGRVEFGSYSDDSHKV